MIKRICVFLYLYNQYHILSIQFRIYDNSGLYITQGFTYSLCHRQYEHTNGSVSLAIYDDRVEIVNPGKFPPQLTVESIRMSHESYPYNKKIAQVLYLTKNLEKWGTGANRMIELCKEQGVPEPEWKVENGTVTVIFKRLSLNQDSEGTSEKLHRNFIESLQKKDREIAKIVINNPNTTQNEMASALKISARAVAK